MKDNTSFFKRRYYDTRLGGVVMSPIIQMANFIAILFLYVRHIIPIEVFAPLFFILGFMALAAIGRKFRDIQASTDYDLLFEKQRAQARVLGSILEAQILSLKKNGIDIPDQIKNDLEYLEDIRSDNLNSKS